ncbi:MAG: ABC-F family ATP-binding cassette domain-containing protein, partial [Hyphomonadaceae bacterium]|nr:ABC-F family ATP-binding cassette domain-containing protein [Clostridia bacterium]
MTILQLNRIHKAFGVDVLFEDVSFEVGENDKIGLVGVNGAGKTSLFKILTGEMPYESGDIVQSKLTQIGYIEQHACHNSENTVFDEFLGVFAPLVAIEQALAEIHHDIEQKKGDIDQLIKRQDSYNKQYEAAGGFLYKSRVRAMLLG